MVCIFVINKECEDRETVTKLIQKAFINDASQSHGGVPKGHLEFIATFPSHCWMES